MASEQCQWSQHCLCRNPPMVDIFGNAESSNLLSLCKTKWLYLTNF